MATRDNNQYNTENDECRVGDIARNLVATNGALNTEEVLS